MKQRQIRRNIVGTQNTESTQVTYELICIRKNEFGDEVAGQVFTKTFATTSEWVYWTEYEVPGLSPKNPVRELQYWTVGSKDWGYKNYR